jgi:hypothetical protein
MERHKWDPKKLQSHVNRCLRLTLGIWWPNVISNEYLWERLKQKEIWREKIYRKWICHILRQDNESIAKKALDWNRQGGRRKEIPRITWRGTVRMEAEHQGKSWLEIKALSKNRIRWRAFIKALCLSEG